MNRENKRKTFEKGYYKTHACRDTFTCKVCGRLCTPETPAATIATTARTAYRACTWTLSRATAKATAAASWSPWPSGKR